MRKKALKKIKRCAEIIIANDQVLLIISEIDNWKKTQEKTYISKCDNKIISYTLTIFIQDKDFIGYTNDEMRYRYEYSNKKWNYLLHPWNMQKTKLKISKARVG